MIVEINYNDGAIMRVSISTDVLRESLKSIGNYLKQQDEISQIGVNETKEMTIHRMSQ